MKLIPFSIFFSLILLTACLPPTQQVKKANTFKKIEPLHQIKIDNKQVVFKVLSTGCTQSDDFIINSLIINQQCQLTIYRIKPDRCKRAALPMKINLSWDKHTHCKNKEILLMNPSINQNPATF